MKIYRLVLMSLAEIQEEVCRRAGHLDLVDRCMEVRVEIRALSELKEGEEPPDG